MSIQDFVFQLSKKVQEKHTVKIARSHIYELIAVNNGYKSYNALIAQNIILNAEYRQNVKHNRFNSNDMQKVLVKKLQGLLKSDIPEKSYTDIAQTIHQELLLLKLEAINLRFIRERLSYIDFENGLISSYENEFEDDFDCEFEQDVNFLEIKRNLDKIKSYAEERQNSDACAVMAGYYKYLANHIAPYGKNGSNFGAKWSNTKYKYIQNEESKKNKQLFEAYIQQAESFEAKSKMQPINLNEILSDEDCEDFYEKLIYLCRKGDVEAIEYYLYDHHFKSEDDAWIYIYLAQMCGKDFTKSDLRAYNAYTGEEYDDYGPIEVAGREAIQNVINLPELSDDQDNLVRKISTELFEKI
jgi:hypothetical protein